MSGVGCIKRGPHRIAGRDPRVDERQHLPLRRLHQHRHRGRERGTQHVADHVSVPVHQGLRRIIRVGGGRVGGPLHRRRHDADRLDARDRRASRSRRRHQRTAVPRHRPAAVEIARRFAGANVGVGRPSRCARTVPGHCTGAGVVGVGADPQHGLDRRQPDAAPALPLLPRRIGRLQPAHAGLRLRRRSEAATAPTRSSGRATRASPPIRPTWRWR